MRVGKEPYVAVLQGEEGMEVIEYLRSVRLPSSQATVDIGDHADLHAGERLRNLRVISGSLDREALGLTEREMDRLRAAFGDLDRQGPRTRQILPFGLGVSPDRPWPNRTLVYEVHSSITNPVLKQRIAEAARIWTATGLVTVRPRRAGDNVRVAIIKAQASWGRIRTLSTAPRRSATSRRTACFLSNKCEKYTVVHELATRSACSMSMGARTERRS
jgi:hypothetical protein